MNALVGYGSSDEEEDAPPERPAKVARTELDPVIVQDTKAETKAPQEPVPPETITIDQPEHHETQPQTEPTAPPPITIDENAAPVGPSLITVPDDTTSNPDSAPPSPYTYERSRRRELTMPTVPDFDIPSSPPPFEPNSEAAAALAATTKKFDRFLELKRQGVHFNARLDTLPAMRNPGFLGNLMKSVAGMEATGKESYVSALPAEVAVRTEWPEECYVEKLMWQSERREKKRMSERTAVEFVPATVAKQ